MFTRTFSLSLVFNFCQSIRRRTKLRYVMRTLDGFNAYHSIPKFLSASSIQFIIDFKAHCIYILQTFFNVWNLVHLFPFLQDKLCFISIHSHVLCWLKIGWKTHRSTFARSKKNVDWRAIFKLFFKNTIENLCHTCTQ